MVLGGIMSIVARFKKMFKNKTEEEKYTTGLAKTRNQLLSNFDNINKRYNEIDSDYLQALEEMLISSDMGMPTVLSFVENLTKRIKKEKIKKTNELKEIIVEELMLLYNGQIDQNKLNYGEDLSVFLFVGVNGSGKTTTIAKMAYRLKKEGKKVLLVAGDTFRAGAVEQLQAWASKIEVPVVAKLNADPASVVYQGLEKGKNENFDVVLIDTAGRLQNKQNLMNELAKINRVIEKFIPKAPHETLLVIDATTGQNGISQAKNFQEIINITGIVLTKLDGTAKGGIVIAIKKVTNIPVKFIGLGEKLTDLDLFNIEKYIYGLFKEW